jgi:chemotaxis protein MotB
MGQLLEPSEDGRLNARLSLNRTRFYRSNWELSSSRALTIEHYMLRNKDVESGRIAIERYADTKPLVPNNSVQNRAKNRRVEIILVQDDPTLALDHN